MIFILVALFCILIKRAKDTPFEFVAVSAPFMHKKPVDRDAFANQFTPVGQKTLDG